MKSPSQATRLLILLLYTTVLVVAAKLALGSWYPPTTEKGLWFYSGLAAIILGNLLVTPFFTKPADAISYCVAAGIALATVNPWNAPLEDSFNRFLWLLAFAAILIVLLSALISIVLWDSPTASWKKLSRTFYQFCEFFGNPRYIFSIVFLFSLIAYHRTVPQEYLVISVTWAIVIGLQPLETSFRLILRLGDIWTDDTPVQPLGEILGHETPGLVIIRTEERSKITLGDTLIVRSDDGSPGLALGLDQIGFADGLWIRAIHLDISEALKTNLSALAARNSSRNVVLRANFEPPADLEINDPIWRKRNQLVGLVSAESDITSLVIEVLRTDNGLEEGRLLEAEIGDRTVLYQIINGLTKEEILQQKNTRGYVRAVAKKIGCWREEKRRFDPVGWLPQPNAPVFLVEATKPSDYREAIGYFPGSSYSVAIEDINALVTHNTAILGILGSGKTFLAIELIERIINEGIKVICLDLTRQYAEELNGYYKQRAERRRIDVLKHTGVDGKENVELNVEDGGSANAFQEVVHRLLKRFLSPGNNEHLLIYNPAEFEVWRQDSRPYQGRASMATLTPTEITRIFTEAALEVLQDQGMTDSARCCIVYEEAHSLIPEWTAVAAEGDKSATNGTARAILQGRKYGLGCMVITQRTANVTKSILNQCNTVIALRVYDATGMDFLKNYIGSDYSGVLSTLDDRHAIVFGRASSCRDPVLVRLNDRDDFLTIFRGPVSPRART